MRIRDIVLGANDAAGELVEDDGLLGDGRALLLAVVAVVHADAEHLVRTGHGGGEHDVGAGDHILTGSKDPVMRLST